MIAASEAFVTGFVGTISAMRRALAGFATVGGATANAGASSPDSSSSRDRLSPGGAARRADRRNAAHRGDRRQRGVRGRDVVAAAARVAVWCGRGGQEDDGGAVG